MQAFGADFSGVRVHTDAQAHQLNQSIQAKAFTTGQDVFVRQGAYEPGSRGGQELLAHELTHVVQQKGEVVQCHNEQIEAKGIQLGQNQNVIQCDPWDQAQSQKERNLAAQQNARVEPGAAAPGIHHVAIGARFALGGQTQGQQRHIDDDMLQTLGIVLNSLPPSHINGNRALGRIVLEHANNRIPSFYDSATHQITIIVPFDAASWVYLNVTKWPLGDLATTLGASEHPAQFLTRDVVGTGSNLNKLKMVPEKFVEWMLRHEIGHSVDQAIKWHTNRHYRNPQCGAWEIHDGQAGATTEQQMGDQILQAVGINGAMRANLDAAFNPDTNAGYDRLSDAITHRNKNELNPPYRRQALQRFEATNPGGSRVVDYAEEVIRVGLNSPYENGGGINLNGRTYHHDPQQNNWVSYQSNKYALRNSNYQYQSPGEWFAETYSKYFIPPQAQWGNKVNDPQAVAWFLNNLDPVNGAGNLIAGGNLVPLPPLGGLGVPGVPVQNPAPPPTQMQAALNTLGTVSLNIATVPVSLVTRTVGTAREQRDFVKSDQNQAIAKKHT